MWLELVGRQRFHLDGFDGVAFVLLTAVAVLELHSSFELVTSQRDLGLWAFGL